MDLTEFPEHKAFRRDARQFLERASRGLFDGFASASWCPAEDDVAAELLSRCLAWQRIKYDAGWAGVSWPQRYGGRGGTEIESLIFSQEEAGAVTPWLSQMLGLGMAGPAILKHGTELQRSQYLGSMLQGQSVWCQLFSEPDAGSDLFGLRTTARRTECGAWIVNGQKVWSSRADRADYGLLLVRTNPDVPKRQGLTLFVLPMRSPGVSCHPIKQLNGGSEFCEVVLQDVEIPETALLGGVGNGDAAARSVLTGERADAGTVTGVAIEVQELLRLAVSADRTIGPQERQQLASFHTRAKIIEFMGLRARTRIERGDPLGPETSLLKLALSHHAEATSGTISSLGGPSVMLAGSTALDGGRWANHILEHLAQRIGGGTDEIQKTTVAEHILDLPRAPGRPPATFREANRRRRKGSTGAGVTSPPGADETELPSGRSPTADKASL